MTKYLPLLALLATACTGEDPVFTDAASGPDSTPTDGGAGSDADVTAPIASITDAPDDPSNDATPSFSFDADEPATFACRIDDAAFAPCTSPFSETVADGAHVFEVRATDDSGNQGEPAQHAWSVDTDPPETTITAGPAALDNSVDVDFTFTSDEAGTFECRLDGAAFVACTSPHPYDDLDDGPHTFEVRAIDLAGNADATAASHAWTLDSTTPDTAIDTGPTGATTATDATFTFSSPDAGDGATFECQLDGGGFTTCTSPEIHSDLDDGEHTFQVRVRDAGGNADPSPATRTWTVDTTDPDTTILSGPTGTVASNAPSFTFSSNEAGATFECQLDTGAYATCTTPKSYTGLADGGHTFRVRAIDVVGHVDPTPATQAWTIDSVLGAPTVTAITTTTADGRYGAGATVTIVITFSEVVYVTGSPTLLLETGPTDRAAALTGGSGTTTLTFTYTVQTGDTTGDLDYAGAGALTGGTILDAAGNAATRTLPAPGATGSLAPTHAVVIAAAPPVMTSVTVTPATAYTDTTLTCAPAATDADGDDVTFTYAWTVNGSTVGGATTSSLTGASFSEGQLVRCVATPSDGGQTGPEMTSSPVTIQNSTPVMASVTVTPSSPTTTSTLTCNASATDADAETVTYTYEWRKGGTTVIAGQTGSTLPGSEIVKNDTISCRVTPSDGTISGTPLTSAGVTVLNSAPTVIGVSVTPSPSPARTSSDLTCAATTSDADGDTVTVAYAWLENNVVIAGQTAATLDDSYVDYNEQIVCRVTPNDGTTSGAAGSSSPTTIANTAPVMSSVTISPSPAYTNDTLTCSATAVDADGHGITYSYEWLRTGSVIGTSQTLAGSAFSRGEQITCRVTPTDTITAGSPMTSSALTISNTAPVMSTVSITPSSPTTTSTLTCNHTASDADGDSLTYTYAWFEGGTNVIAGQTASTLLGSQIDRGDVITCRVTPNDGTVGGTAMTSASVTVANTGPTVTGVTVTASPSPARTNSDLTCAATTSDADGDTVTVTYVWSNGSGPIPGQTGATLDDLYVAYNDQITCTVTPSDGTSTGTAASSTPITIANTAPVMSSVTISPSPAYTNDTLTCSPTAVDADGHGVSYSYEWLRSSVVIGTAQTLSGSVFSRGEQITCRVTPTDTYNAGSPMTSSALTISNTAPVMSSVWITPSPAYETSTLTCNRSAGDPDGDSISYTYQWFVTNVFAGSGQTIDGGSFNKGQAVYCIATPSDGTATGTGMQSGTIAISNSPPTNPTAVTLSPADPMWNSTLTCSYGASSDPDGDAVTHVITWFNDAGVIAGQTGANLAPASFAPGDKITCMVMASDSSGAASADVYSNSVIIPDAPRCEPVRELTCGQGHEWATTLEGSTDVIDTYSCSGWNESGREYGYYFTSPFTGQVTATIQSGVDLDLFVVPYNDDGNVCSSAGCTAAGNTDVTFSAVEGRTYFIVVDGYNGAEGGYFVQLNCQG